MTIPITPGPFSFLSSAGEAVGEIGKALEIKRQRLDAEAHSRLNDILTLIQAGADPAPFLASGGAAAERLKLAGPGEGARLLSGPAERARLALRLSQATTRKEEAGATVEETTAQNAPAMAQESLAQARANTRTANAQASGAESDLPIRQRINQLITEELANPEKDFGRLAARAAAGTLPYYSVLIQSRAQDRSIERQQNADRFKLFFEPLDNAGPLWQQRVQQWETRKTLETSGFSPEEVKNWEKDNPPPELKAVQQELLTNAATARGLTVDQYNTELNKTVGMLNDAVNSHMSPQKQLLLQQRVQDVRSGKKTAAQVEQEITEAYKLQGGAGADLNARIDILEFHSMLGAASDSKPKR